MPYEKNGTATGDAWLIDKRRIRMDQIRHAIMEEVEQVIPAEFHRDLHDALAEVLHRNGVHIMTDQDRAEMGLEPRDGIGWTASERVQLKMQRHEAMLQMANFAFSLKDKPDAL